MQTGGLRIRRGRWSGLPLSLFGPRCSVALFASGGGLFTAEKSPKRAGGCGPRTPIGPRGVHPRKRHFPGRYAPPGHPVPYPHPFPASRGPVESEGRYGYRTFHSGRTDCPGNVGRILHTAVFTRNLSVPAVDNAHCASECLRYQSASVERTGKRFPRRGRCLHRPAPRSGLLLQVRWLRIAVCIAAPLSSP